MLLQLLLSLQRPVYEALKMRVDVHALALLAAVALSVSSASSMAQTACPIGVAAGSAQCLPDRNSNSGVDGGDYAQPAPRTVYVPTGEWRNGYGAVAMDAKRGAIGVTTLQPSREAANESAIGACKKQGGIDCVVTSPFLNVCAALAGPINSAGSMSLRTDDFDIEIAKRTAREGCERANDKPCAVEWSGCSKSEYFRY